MGGGGLQEVVAHGGSIVYARQRSCDYHYYQGQIAQMYFIRKDCLT